MSNGPSPVSTSRHRALVGAALALFGLTVLLPSGLFLFLLVTASAIYVGARLLALSHGLEPTTFGAGVYLAGLALLATGLWQLGLWLSSGRRALPSARSAAVPPPPNAPASKKPDSSQPYLQHPWAFLGTLLIINYWLVRLELSSTLNSPDGLLAAGLLVGMVYLPFWVLYWSWRLTRSLYRVLWRGSVRSPFVAGSVATITGTLGLFYLLSMLLLAQTAKSQLADALADTPQLTTTPNPPVSLDEVRQALAEFGETRQPSSPPALSDGGSSMPAALVSSPAFAQCIDSLMAPDTKGDPVRLATAYLTTAFSMNGFDARTLVFDTLVSVCLRKAGDTELKGYFWRALGNAARNFHRRYLRPSRHCSLELASLDQLEATPASADYESRLAARGAFCRLQAVDQGLILQRVVEEKSFREIGDAFDLSENAAEKAFNRAMKRLRRLYEEKN
jgi:DNA-directed RNA polymerase specialized sigma24 family protein